MKKKLCYIFSDVDMSHLVEAMVNFTDKQKFDLHVVFMRNQPPDLLSILEEKGHRVHFLEYHSRKDLPSVIWKLRKMFNEIKPDIIHTHLVNANFAGLIAAKLAGIKQRVHTRHHSIETHVYFPRGVYYDKFANWLSTDVVAITNMVADVLVKKEDINPKKVSVVRHGFDWKYFDDALASGTNLKEKYKLDGFYPIIGVISRQIHWKGIQYTIAAFKEILINYPKAKLVLANAHGPYAQEVRRLLSELPAESYLLIEFEKRVFELYKAFDIFVHVPINPEFEAFGQVYVEALAMRVPSVFTLSGVAPDFIEDKQNALVVPFEDSNSIVNAVSEIIQNESLRERLIEKGQKSVKKNFHASSMVEGLEKVYLSK